MKRHLFDFLQHAVQPPGCCIASLPASKQSPPGFAQVLHAKTPTMLCLSSALTHITCDMQVIDTRLQRSLQQQQQQQHQWRHPQTGTTTMWFWRGGQLLAGMLLSFSNSKRWCCCHCSTLRYSSTWASRLPEASCSMAHQVYHTTGAVEGPVCSC